MLSIIALIVSLIFITGCSNGIPTVKGFEVFFTVLDENNIPIENAVTTLDGKSKVTDSDGIAIFTKLDGTYDYNISANNYESKEGLVVVSGDNVSVNINLNQLTTGYSITFFVQDAKGDPIKSATIIFDNEEGTTNSNGIFSFIRPDGTYNYGVNAEGYLGLVDQTITVEGANLTEIINLSLDTPDGYIGIFDWEDLNNVRNDLGAAYFLMNNLDSNTPGYNTYASSTANEGSGWLPIGDDQNQFAGRFKGNNFIISDLFIHRPSETFIGLFARINGQEGVIIDLGLEKVTITGKSSVGGLAGMLSGSNPSIENCFSTGNISGEAYVGGLIGAALNSILMGCYSTASISGENNVGGLVGGLNSSKVIDCFSTSKVIGNLRVGGLIGDNSGPGIKGLHYVSESFATGEINGTSYVGGLVGRNSNNDIINCFASGNVSGAGFFVGGLLGWTEGLDIENCYAKGTVTNNSKHTGGLVGYLKTSKVYNSYARGDVSGNEAVGGLIGTAEADIKHCYAIGTVIGEKYVGGLAGFTTQNCFIFDSFSLYNIDYEIVGRLYYFDRLLGRVTEAYLEDMQEEKIYTTAEYLPGTHYLNMYEAWDITLWNFGTETNPAFPTLFWE